MEQKFSVGELVEIKSDDEMREFMLHKDPYLWWNPSMYALCWKQFTITSIDEMRKGQIINWHGTWWSIWNDMIKRVVTPIQWGNTVRVKSLEQIHKIISDGITRGWTDGDGMMALCWTIATTCSRLSGDYFCIGSYFVHKDFVEPVLPTDTTVPTISAPSDRKKPRIQFSKIR